MATTPGLLLARAAHPRQALVTATVLGGAAAASGRPLREVGLVAATVLVGQVVLGWADDLADRDRDRRRRPGKPLAGERLEPGTVWFALACAVLLVVPLSVANGTLAAGAYLGSLVLAAVGDRLLHARVLSFVPWTLSFSLYPAFLAYGGWAGTGATTPPTVAMTALAAALGVCVHLLTAMPGLAEDHEEGEHSLPLVLALRTGTPRLLVLTRVATALVGVGVLISGWTAGLT